MRLARKYRRRHRSSGQPTPNPGLSRDFMDLVLPGFASFAAARFTTRMVTLAIAKKWPKLAHHAGAIASVGVFAGGYYGAHKISALSKYHEGIMLGTGVATMATLLQTYVPAMGWIIAEVAPAELAPPAPAAGELADDEWGYANDAFDGGRYQAPVAKVIPAGAGVPMSSRAAEVAQEQSVIDDFIAEMNAEPGGGGIFAGGGN